MRNCFVQQTYLDSEHYTSFKDHELNWKYRLFFNYPCLLAMLNRACVSFEMCKQCSTIFDRYSWNIILANTEYKCQKHGSNMFSLKFFIASCRQCYSYNEVIEYDFVVSILLLCDFFKGCSCKLLWRTRFCKYYMYYTCTIYTKYKLYYMFV